MECSANEISENLPVGWKTLVQGVNGHVSYTTSDGVVLASQAHAKKYLVGPRMSGIGVAVSWES